MGDPMATNPCGDGWFGPIVATESCRGGFDFTMLFESTILAVTPSACFLLLAPFRFFQLSRQSPKVVSSSLRMATLVSALDLAIVKPNKMLKRAHL